MVRVGYRFIQRCTLTKTAITSGLGEFYFLDPQRCSKSSVAKYGMINCYTLSFSSRIGELLAQWPLMFCGREFQYDSISASHH